MKGVDTFVIELVNFGAGRLHRRRLHRLLKSILENIYTKWTVQKICSANICNSTSNKRTDFLNLKRLEKPGNPLISRRCPDTKMEKGKGSRIIVRKIAIDDTNMQSILSKDLKKKIKMESRVG